MNYPSQNPEDDFFERAKHLPTTAAAPFSSDLQPFRDPHLIMRAVTRLVFVYPAKWLAFTDAGLWTRNVVGLLAGLLGIWLSEPLLGTAALGIASSVVAQGAYRLWKLASAAFREAVEDEMARIQIEDKWLEADEVAAIYEDRGAG